MKRLFTIIAFIVITSATVLAQHTVILTNNDTIHGLITNVSKQSIHIICADSVHVYDVPIAQVLNYSKEGEVIRITDKERYGYRTETNGANNNLTAGDELIKASSNYYAGMVISTLGLVVSSAGSYAYGLSKDADPNTQKTIVYAGIGVAMVGMIINISAFSHIANAGRKLNATVSSNGLGVSMNF